MIEHSVFALPFAYIAALTAMHSLGDRGVRWLDLLWITVAMVGARTFAMAANRVIDRELDARNPRTAQRELVTGALPVRTAYAGMAVALVVFLGAGRGLGRLPLLLAPLAVVPLVVYPYGKRFTGAATSSWVRPDDRADRRVDRRDRRVVVGRRAARRRDGAVDRGLRRHLRLPGLRARPRRGRPLAPRAASGSVRRWASPPPYTLVALGFFAWFGVAGRLRRLVVRPASR
jgi:hypothetical protein